MTPKKIKPVRCWINGCETAAAYTCSTISWGTVPVCRAHRNAFVCVRVRPVAPKRKRKAKK